MIAIVTGATGFLGSAITQELAKEHGPQSVVGLIRNPLPDAERAAAERLHASGVRLIPCDLMAYPVLPSVDVEPDVIYHLAAETDSSASPDRLLINTQGTRNLIHTFGRRLKDKRVVLAGATAAIDRARRPRNLMSESDLPAPRTAYGRSKLEAEQILVQGGSEFGFRWSVARFSPVWTADPLTGFLGAFREQVLARSVMRRIRWPGRITIVHRDDAVAILRRLGETGAGDGRAVHVGDGEVHVYADLMADLRRLAGDEGWSLPIPGFLWSFIRWCAWLPLAKRLVPWRLSCLLGDDLAVDTAVLRKIHPDPMTRWADARDDIRM